MLDIFQDDPRVTMALVLVHKLEADLFKVKFVDGSSRDKWTYVVSMLSTGQSIVQCHL